MGTPVDAYFSGNESVLGIKTQTIRDIYGFLIGSIFAGVIGTHLHLACSYCSLLLLLCFRLLLKRYLILR